MGGQFVYDHFVGADGFVLQSQTSVRGEVPGVGAGELTEIRSFRDANAAIVVRPPEVQ